MSAEWFLLTLVNSTSIGLAAWLLEVDLLDLRQACAVFGGAVILINGLDADGGPR